MLQPLRTVVVDDEPSVREALRALLEGDPDIQLVGEAGDGPEALEQLRRLRPDLVMLDVQMPELNGFEVLAQLAPGPLPAVIIVTAYDQYALRAFRVHALDYLLRPFTDERFREALEHAKRLVRLGRVDALGERFLRALAARDAARSAHLRRLAIKETGRTVLLDVSEIDWIEAADYYVQIHAGSHTYLHRESMQHLEGRLDPQCFTRIHRSTIVNLERIRELRGEGHHELVAVLSSGAALPVSQSCREKLQHLV